MKHLAETDRTYVTLDDPLLRELAGTDPALLLLAQWAPGAPLLLPGQGPEGDRPPHPPGRHPLSHRDQEDRPSGQGRRAPFPGPGESGAGSGPGGAGGAHLPRGDARGDPGRGQFGPRGRAL